MDFWKIKHYNNGVDLIHSYLSKISTNVVNLLFKVLLLIFVIPFTECTNLQKPQSRIEYYTSWTGYSHPVRLIGKIDSSQVKIFEAYYIANFEEDKLVSVTKYLNDTILYTFNYVYDSTGRYVGMK